MVSPTGETRWYSGVAAILAALITFALFVTALGNQFVDFDDLGYIATNPNLRNLDLQTLRWAFFQSPEANWHPLTLLSLALEYQLWGLAADSVHLTNITIHCCTVFSAYFLFRDLLRMIQPWLGAEGLPPTPSLVFAQTSTHSHDTLIILCSLAAALFFGIHPLRVESVVWASERKDVLCMFFVVNAIRTYLRFSRQSALRPHTPFWRIGSYWATFVLACMGQLSKPVAVSLPFVLLIMDRYPLGRSASGRQWLSRLAEKMPFFLVSVFGALMTIAAQRIAMVRAPDVDLLSRLLVACKALVFYLVKTVWPADLTAFYLHPGQVASASLAEFLIPAAVVGVISLAAMTVDRRFEAWRAFWLYFVVTLIPMLGLIQVGGQWVADRYSYFPSLGMSLLWGACLMWIIVRLQRVGRSRAMLCCILVSACQLALYGVLTLQQIKVWRTTESLMTRIIDRAERQSWSSFYTRAKYRNENNRLEQALEDIDRSLELARQEGRVERYTEIAIARAHVLYRLGRISAALSAAEWGLRNSIGAPPDRYNRFWLELKRVDQEQGAGR